MSQAVKNVKQQFSYQNYLNFSDDQKYEIIEGSLFAMTPAPSIQHQRVLRRIFLSLANYLEGEECEVFTSPVDVLLQNGEGLIEDVNNIVQPDIFVVCEQSKLKEKHCLGAPDFIVEIASPANASLDYVKKLNLYEKYKVREYWIVNYVKKNVLVYRLRENGEYDTPETYDDIEKDRINVGIFKGLTVNLRDFFQN
ncbi:MAG: Uma2 family endonuclease [Desulfotomaculaceae bacterium]